MKKTRIINLLIEILAWLSALIILIPFFLIIINSFKDQAGASLMTINLPEVYHWGNYLTVIREGNLIRSFFNSLILASFSVVLSVFASSMVAFVLSRKKSKLNNIIYYYFLLGLVAPINMVTVIKTLQIFNIMGTYQGYILFYTGWMVPFGVFLYYGFINRTPEELDEAAIIDGCNSFSLFFRVIFPILKPVTVTLSVIHFMNAWNDFRTPLYLLNRASKWPMTLAVYNFYGQRVTEWQLVSATIILTILPILIVYMLGQKYIVSGMTSGAVKG